MGPEASSSKGETPMQSAHRNRLLRDIAELQQRPYPNIRLVPVDLTRACLVLTPSQYPPLHLTVEFGPRYPLLPPTVTIQGGVVHPNVYGNYICASILNTTEGYTPAYTLKGICIQLLSFFSSDTVEQDWGGIVILADYRKEMDVDTYAGASGCGRDTCTRCSILAKGTWSCADCGFGKPEEKAGAGEEKQKKNETKKTNGTISSSLSVPGNGAQKTALNGATISSLPDELLLEMLDTIDFEDLMSFAQAWPRVRQLLRDYDLIRSRELQCFTLKANYREANLGVGIALVPAGLIPRIDSEFDLVSFEAYKELEVRRSVHGIPFHHWLPLPLSHRHWYRVEPAASAALQHIAINMKKMGGGAGQSDIGVLFTFMNDVVVRLNLDLEGRGGPPRSRHERERESKSTLRYASEKAIESYFHLFHLLVCLATARSGRSIVEKANSMIQSFLKGNRGKEYVPNLGHLLTALLVSDIDVTDELRKAIITEAITRNVVWLLDGRGAGSAELGFLETDKTSHYRLQKTFQGSKTSYRLLMFSEMFRRTARPLVRSEDGSLVKPSLGQVRDALFARHGAPPEGAAARLAAEVRRLQQIDSFPAFLSEMGVLHVPSASNFTQVLRQAVVESIQRGYCRAVPPRSLLSLRILRDKEMDRFAALKQLRREDARWVYSDAGAKRTELQVASGKLSFFPERRNGRRR